MKTYYIRINDENHGPYSFEELKNVSLDKESYVWSEGYSNWMQAKNIDELTSLLSPATPPPFISPPPFEQELYSTNFHHTYQQSDTEQVTTTEKVGFRLGRFLKRFGIVTILALIIVGVLYYRNADAYSRTFTFSDPEQNSPELYLNASGKFHPSNLIGQLVINGTITNTASHTNYKDAVVRVTFYSATESVVDTKDYVIYDLFPYGSTKTFKLKISKPASRSVGWETVSATRY